MNSSNTIGLVVTGINENRVIVVDVNTGDGSDKVFDGF